jgi:hypothetical protein
VWEGQGHADSRWQRRFPKEGREQGCVPGQQTGSEHDSRSYDYEAGRAVVAPAEAEKRYTLALAMEDLAEEQHKQRHGNAGNGLWRGAATLPVDVQSITNERGQLHSH